MPDLAIELSHLARADAHIQQLDRNIAQALRSIADRQKLAVGLGGSLAPLDALRGALDAIQGHRALIMRTITDKTRQGLGFCRAGQKHGGILGKNGGKPIRQ